MLGDRRRPLYVLILRRRDTMLDHVGFAVSDYDRSLAFYKAALAPLGCGLVMEIPREVTSDCRCRSRIARARGDCHDRYG